MLIYPQTNHIFRQSLHFKPETRDPELAKSWSSFQDVFDFLFFFHSLFSAQTLQRVFTSFLAAAARAVSDVMSPFSFA